MSGLGSILLLALLPGLGNLIGGLLALWAKPPRWFTGVALHSAAGIAIAVVSLELMPLSIEQGRTPALIATFLGGAVVSILLASSIERRQGDAAGPLMVVLAMVIDLATDGLMTGAGSGISAKLGLLLAASQVVGNIPNGFAAMANLDERLALGWKLGLMLVLPAIPVLGAAIGYLALRSASPEIQAAALAFMAGMLLLATIEDTVSQGDEPSPPRRYSSLAFAGGFALMMLASAVAES